MRFQCGQCREPMGYQEAEPRPEGAVNLRFRCRRCGWDVNLLANAGEAGMVKAMGIKLGATENAPAPFELAAGFAEGPALEAPRWTDSAQARIRKIPDFVRGMVSQNVVAYARRQGISLIDDAVMDAFKQSGMAEMGA